MNLAAKPGAKSLNGIVKIMQTYAVNAKGHVDPVAKNQVSCNRHKIVPRGL